MGTGKVTGMASPRQKNPGQKNKKAGIPILVLLSDLFFTPDFFASFGCSHLAAAPHLV
jgi:hypothetical protein